jgi:arginase
MSWGLRRAGADALRDSSSPVLEWISDQGISQLAIHFDLDVLDSASFRAVVFNKPDSQPGFLAGVPRGRMKPEQVVRLLQDVGRACDVVGLAITEHMPWDTLAMRNMLRRLPLLAG